MQFEFTGNRMAAIGGCQPDRLHLLRALAFLCVVCVEALRHRYKDKSFNTEDTEKNEDTENSCQNVETEIFRAGPRNFSLLQGLRIMRIGRMKLKVEKCVRMRNICAANGMTQL